MNDIQVAQNKAEFIQLLTAQRNAYSKAKKYQIIEVIALFVSIALPFRTMFDKNLTKNLLLFGFLWVLLYLALEYFRKKRILQGAKIQEEFDTSLFKLPWNKIKCDNKVKADTKVKLARKDQNGDFKNWYSTEITSEIPHNIAVLLCQRINCSWELDLRKKFLFFLLSLSFIYYLTLVLYSIYTDYNIYEFLLFISPSSAFMVYIIKNARAFKNQYDRKNTVMEKIDSILEGLTEGTWLSVETLRQIQDEIFQSRTVSENIPDWFYKRFKNDNENRTDEIIKNIKSNL